MTYLYVRLRTLLDGRLQTPLSLGDHNAGSVTAEYAMVMIAACGFAALLVSILRSGQMHDILLGLVRRALGGA